LCFISSLPQAIDAWGALDVLVNNAGLDIFIPFAMCCLPYLFIFEKSLFLG